MRLLADPSKLFFFMIYWYDEHLIHNTFMFRLLLQHLYKKQYGKYVNEKEHNNNMESVNMKY
jgi:hypothetical protein